VGLDLKIESDVLTLNTIINTSSLSRVFLTVDWKYLSRYDAEATWRNAWALDFGKFVIPFAWLYPMHYGYIHMVLVFSKPTVLFPKLSLWNNARSRTRWCSHCSKWTPPNQKKCLHFEFSFQSDGMIHPIPLNPMKYWLILGLLLRYNALTVFLGTVFRLIFYPLFRY
jgi:hypothetical protein